MFYLFAINAIYNKHFKAICNKHFKEKDFLQTATKKCLKLGVLPSQNLPVKSHPSKIPQEQRSIIRYSQPSLANYSKSFAQQPTSINDISQQFSQMKLTKWQIFVANDFVRFTYSSNIDHHHVADVSLLIKDNSVDSSGLDFSTSFHGRFAAEITKQLSFENFSLYEMLDFLKQQSAKAMQVFLINLNGYV